MAKAAQLTHKERLEADTAALLSDAIEAGGQVSIRLDLSGGARVRINLDRVPNQKAMALYLRYRHAKRALLFKAASALLSEHLERAQSESANA